MATGWGVGQDPQGNGTTPEDIQRINAAQYSNPGILAGCEVTGTTAMSYSVKAGAVVIQIAPDRYVIAAVSPAIVPTEPAPNVGSRTDVIYVKQNFYQTDGSITTVVGVGRSVPANSVEIARYTVRAGTSSTRQATKVGDTKYARPHGGSLGTLASFVDTDGAVRSRGQVYRRGAVSFYLPTDRQVEFSLQSCVAVADVDGPLGAPRVPGGSLLYSIYVDDILQRSFERRYDNVWDTVHFEFGMLLNSGRHTAHYTVESRWHEQGHTGKWKVNYGHEAKFPGDIFHINDRGVALV